VPQRPDQFIPVNFAADEKELLGKGREKAGLPDFSWYNLPK
jgi:hypothetical protein